MPARVRKDETVKPLTRRKSPATTVQGRENQLTGLATDLAEQQLEAGTASAQVITHYLKLATVRESLEREKLIAENKLLTARVETLQSNANMETLYKEAIAAFTSYRGDDTPDEFID